MALSIQRISLRINQQVESYLSLVLMSVLRAGEPVCTHITTLTVHNNPHFLALRLTLRRFACWLPVLISGMEALQGAVATRISYPPHEPARISLRINQQVISTSWELILLSVSQRVSSAYPSWCRLSGCHTFRTGRLFSHIRPSVWAFTVLLYHPQPPILCGKVL